MGAEGLIWTLYAVFATLAFVVGVLADRYGAGKPKTKKLTGKHRA